MISIYKMKAMACSILAVMTGASVLGLMWMAVFAHWPTQLGLVLVTVFQIILMIYFIGNITYARVHADIGPMEEKNT